MGHLTLMSEDVITALEHYPPELRLIIEQHAPQPAWNDYVTGRYNETKKRDTSLLGGGKPAVNNAPRAGARWAVDEEDVKTTAVPSNGNPGANGEFKRTTGSRPTRETSADFGPAPMDDDEDDHGTGPPQVRSLSHSFVICPLILHIVCSLSCSGNAVWRMFFFGRFGR